MKYLSHYQPKLHLTIYVNSINVSKIYKNNEIRNKHCLQHLNVLVLEIRH